MNVKLVRQDNGLWTISLQRTSIKEIPVRAQSDVKSEDRSATVARMVSAMRGEDVPA